MTPYSETMNVFRGLLESPQNKLVEQAASQGRIPIGYSCSFVPEALLMVPPLFPVRLRAPGVAGTEVADNYMSSFICSYTRSLLEYAYDDRFDLVEGWVFVPSCAHMQRLYDNLDYLKKPKFNHVIDVPRKISEATVEWLTEELRMIADKLSSHFGVDMTSGSVLRAIGEWNEFARIIEDINNLRKRPDPPITGTEFHTLLMASLASPKDLILPKVLEVREELKDRAGRTDHRARLMLVGAHLHDPEFIRVIESQGGLVVADRICTGYLPGLKPVEAVGDPFRSLAEHSFKKTLCPRMMENYELRVQAIRNAVREYRVDGVVVEVLKFCDLWGVEAMTLVSDLRSAGIPVLKLEREYSLSGEGQLRTRVQAFIESMGK